MHRFRLFAAVGCTAALCLAAAGHASAQYVETGDAGTTIATANSTVSALSPSGSQLTTISGNISSQQDADLYAINITTPSLFSASTDNAVTNLDTALFLFNSNGMPIATNDDAPNGLSLGSTLPAGNSLYANLPAGIYYLGISLTGNEPINVNSQLLFAPYPGGDTTAVRGPAGVSPNTLAGFDNASSDSETTTFYRIDLTSVTAAVPEPSTWALLGFGLTIVGVAVSRRRTVA